MKKIIKKILNKISRVIYHITPKEFRNDYNIKTKYILEEKNKSFDTFKKYFRRSIMFDTEEDIQKFAIEESIKNDKDSDKFYLEFGVFKGRSINFFSKYVKQIYGFDSFEGLKEHWIGAINAPKGTFNLDKKIPALNDNVVAVQGWIQDTLRKFLSEKNPKVNFVHIDVDTYDTTLFILKELKPFLDKNSTILFDEIHNIPGWEVGEYKALKEIFTDNEYEFIAFDFEKRAVIRIK